MNKSLLIGSLIAAAALTACGKKEEAPAVVAPPAAAPAPAPAPAPAEPAAAAPAPAPSSDASTTPAPGASAALDAANAATEEAKKQQEGTPPAKP